MAVSGWQRRIERANELAREHSFAAEMLDFYGEVAQFQEDWHRWAVQKFPSTSGRLTDELGAGELPLLQSRFGDFLSLVEKCGPRPLAEVCRELRSGNPAAWSDLLRTAWTSSAPSDAQLVLTQIFLQPYAEFLRSRSSPEATGHAHALCPFCHRKPGLGVMRQMGDGGARSMICAFCLAEWEFRRLVCPGCGEENDRKLPIFSADKFNYIRLECCESCKTYVKTIDLTRNGRAEPVVDELASAPLDLWIGERGYAKLQKNLLGM